MSIRFLFFNTLQKIQSPKHRRTKENSKTRMRIGFIFTIKSRFAQYLEDFGSHLTFLYTYKTTSARNIQGRRGALE